MSNIVPYRPVEAGSISRSAPNNLFRGMMAARKPEYARATNKQKASIASSLISQWEAQTPRGRFLKRRSGCAAEVYHEADDAEKKLAIQRYYSRKGNNVQKPSSSAVAAAVAEAVPATSIPALLGVDPRLSSGAASRLSTIEHDAASRPRSVSDCDLLGVAGADGGESAEREPLDDSEPRVLEAGKQQGMPGSPPPTAHAPREHEDRAPSSNRCTADAGAAAPSGTANAWPLSSARDEGKRTEEL